MLSEKASGFLEANHHAVLSTFRKSGAAQMSIVTCGRYGDGVAFTTTEGRAKYANLVRDPRCAILVSQSDWWGYVVLEGRASVMSRHNTDAAELARALREVYRAASGREHPDWDEYDAAMARERRVAVIVSRSACTEQRHRRQRRGQARPGFIPAPTASAHSERRSHSLPDRRLAWSNE